MILVCVWASEYELGWWCEGMWVITFLFVFFFFSCLPWRFVDSLLVAEWANLEYYSCKIFLLPSLGIQTSIQITSITLDDCWSKFFMFHAGFWRKLPMGRAKRRRVVATVLVTLVMGLERNGIIVSDKFWRSWATLFGDCLIFLYPSLLWLVLLQLAGLQRFVWRLMC